MKPDIVILPSFAQVEDWRKRHAATSAEGLFAQTVTTFNAWIADLWELHGDGRAIVDSLKISRPYTMSCEARAMMAG